MFNIVAGDTNLAALFTYWWVRTRQVEQSHQGKQRLLKDRDRISRTVKALQGGIHWRHVSASSLVSAIFFCECFYCPGNSKGPVPSSKGSAQFSTGLDFSPRPPLHPLVGFWHFSKGYFSPHRVIFSSQATSFLSWKAVILFLMFSCNNLIFFFSPDLFPLPKALFFFQKCSCLLW